MKKVFVNVCAHALDRKDATRSLRLLSPTLEKHLIKLSFCEDRYRKHWLREINNYVNIEFDFLIKKKTGISRHGIYAVLFGEKSRELESRILRYLDILEEDGYLVDRELQVEDVIPKFESFYNLLSDALFARYESRKLNLRIDIEELLRTCGII